MTTSSYDVAIIGLGPSGAVAAALLGQTGLRVLVVDKSRVVFDKPRAVGMDHEIMRVMQACGVAEQIKPFTAPFTLSENFGANGQLIRKVGMLPPPYPMGWTPSMVFQQPIFEQIVRDRITELPSVTQLLGVELLDLQQDDDGVEIHLRGDDGSSHAARARYLIGCDGASSTVRRLLGIPVEDLGFNEPWLVIDLLANERGLSKLPRVSTHFCDPRRPAMFVVCTANHRRWEIMLLPGEDAREMEREDKVWQILSRWIEPGDAVLWRRASYRFRALMARQWRKGRVFLAGDAAHQQPPFLGQGMCQGIRDVANLCWKLQLVLGAKASDALLDSYQEERSVHVRELITTILGIGRTICELDPVAARERDARLLASGNGAVPTVIRQALMPTLRSGFLHPQPHPARGTLFPQPWVLRDGEAVRLDDAAGGGWRVVLDEQAQSWQLRAPAFMRVDRVDANAAANGWQETEGVLTGWMASYACAAAVVRPDHCVYAVANSNACLQEIFDTLTRELIPV